MKLTVNNKVYKIGKLDALQQFHISRRLLPVLATLGVTLDMLKDAAGTEMTSMAQFLPAMEPISKVLAAMSDEDSEYVLFTCLSAVTREEGEGRFAAVSTGARLQFQDIDMVAMIRLAVEVVKENLLGFFVGLGETKS